MKRLVDQIGDQDPRAARLGRLLSSVRMVSPSDSARHRVIARFEQASSSGRRRVAGPFRMAAMLGYPVYFMTGLYGGGNRYALHFELLAEFASVPRSQRDAVVRETLEKYAATLERHCKASPYNWFNFFDFWEPAP